MNITQRLRQVLRQRPDGIASAFQGARKTYAELCARVSKLAGALQGLGLNAGDRVGMLSQNSDRYLEYFLAVWWAGGVVNPVNSRWSASEIAYSLDDCDTTILIVDDTFRSMAQSLTKSCKSLEILIYAGEGAAPVGMFSYEQLVADCMPVEDANRRPNELAGIFYTGGNTVHPKGVMLSQSNLLSNCLSLLDTGVLGSDSVGLHAAPMGNLANTIFMLALLNLGATNVIIPCFNSLIALDAIQSEEATVSLLVPVMIQNLIDHPDFERFSLSSLKSVLCGAPSVSGSFIERAMKAFPSTVFCQIYGMTEAFPVSTLQLQPSHLSEGVAIGKVGSAGTACKGTEVRVIESETTKVSPERMGEIAVRGPGVMLGYWNKPAETSAAFQHGWLRTGDAGHIDDDDYIFIIERLQDMIVTGRENVYCIEVESALKKHPAVAECAVIGIPEPHWGELVYAAVVLKPDSHVTSDSIIDHCRSYVASYKCPRKVIFVDALPEDCAARSVRKMLRDPFWRDQQRSVA